MNPALSPRDNDIRERLGLDAAAGRRAWTRRGPWLALAVLAALAAAFAVFALRGGEAAPRYATAPAAIGDLVETVTATGTLEALDTVEVGSEVSGRVEAVHVDFNDRVARGQALATIDPEEAAARAEQAAAQLQSAHASVARSQASAEEAAANLRRIESLAAAGLVSEQELDASRATAERARADVAAARAQATVSGASLTSSHASLAKTEIRSPIDGVVLARSVEPGQTVAASLQAPVLFTLARDLTRMTLHVDVDEADVGKVREGQPATFTVDAYPERTFRSQVVSLRNVPKDEAGVVTYEAVLAVDNAELLLRPGMTASADIVTDEKRGQLLVPNAALRFTPPEVAAAEQDGRRGLFLPGISSRRGGRGERSGDQAAERGGAAARGGATAAGAGRAAAAEGAGAPGGEGGADRRGAAAGGAASPAAERSPAAASGFPGARRAGGGGGTVWVLRAGEPVAVAVAPVASDGVRTAVRSPALSPGDEVIVDVAVAEAAS
jgi:HlyD family secretion protein